MKLRADSSQHVIQHTFLHFLAFQSFVGRCTVCVCVCVCVYREVQCFKVLCKLGHCGDNNDNAGQQQTSIIVYNYYKRAGPRVLFVTSIGITMGSYSQYGRSSHYKCSEGRRRELRPLWPCLVERSGTSGLPPCA